jgi:glucose-6-phosphate isomerase, archaeal
MSAEQGAAMPSTPPFRATVDAAGRLAPATSTIARRLSDMRGFYADPDAEAALAAEDPLVYEVFQYDVPETAGELFTCTTVLHPGRVGDEYFMTKGHYHQVRDRAEVYFGLAGRGRLLLQTESGDFESTEMEPGTVAYVPPRWGHRTVNTGDEDFVFLAVYPGDAGHDYGSIEITGFARRLVDRDGTPTLVAAERA